MIGCQLKGKEMISLFSEKIENKPVGVIHGIAETRRVDDGQSQLHALLLQNDRRRIDGNAFLLSMKRRRKILPGEFRLEQRVNEGGLAETRLT
jgi:hypothetical protein